MARLDGALDYDVPIYGIHVPDNPYGKSNYYVEINHVGSSWYGYKGCPGQELEFIFQVWGKTKHMDVISDILNNISVLITTTNSQTVNLLTTTSFWVIYQFDAGSVVESYSPEINRGEVRILFVTEEK